MIRHVVLVRFGAHASEAERVSIFDALDRLRDVVPGMGAFSSGTNHSPEGLDRGFTHAFTIDFDDVESRDAYLEHPAHKAAGTRLVAALEGGIEGLLVFDIPVGV